MEKNKEIEFLREKNFNKLKQKVGLLKKEGKKIVFVSSDDELNRKVVEKLEIDFLMVSLSGNERRDFMKQRNSGLNEIIVKICKKKNIGMGIDFEEILKVGEKEKSVLFSRIRQNIFLCKKNNVNMKFFNFDGRDKKGLKSLGSVLGMSSEMTKNSL